MSPTVYKAESPEKKLFYEELLAAEALANVEKLAKLPSYSPWKFKLANDRLAFDLKFTGNRDAALEQLSSVGVKDVGTDDRDSIIWINEQPVTDIEVDEGVWSSHVPFTEYVAAAMDSGELSESMINEMETDALRAKAKEGSNKTQ